MDFRASTFANSLMFIYLQSSYLPSLKVVEKYHDLIKTCYLQICTDNKDKINHIQRAIIRAERNGFQFEVDFNLYVK